jgi:glycosyltransferase involved in cell wall biosynthesis
MTTQNEWMDRRVWASADALVVKSEFMKREMEQLYGLAAARLHVIPNGVDHARFSGGAPAARVLEQLGNSNHTKTVISFCGRLVPMKNVALLLGAFARMESRARCVLAIMGDGDERANLERTARDLGIAASVRFLGQIDRVEEYIAASDISVLPSTYEPFGNALLEAMAAGVPCIALEPDGSAIRTASDEIIEHGRTGLLVPGGAPGPLASALDELVGNPELRKTLGRRAQAVCRTRYSWDTCAAAYVDLLKTVGDRLAVRGGR